MYIVASAVDWFTIEKKHEVTVNKKFRIWTTDDRVAEALYSYYFDPNSGHKVFVESLWNLRRRLRITGNNLLRLIGDHSPVVE